MPDAVVGAVVADGLDGQPVGGKWFPVIDQMCFGGDDLKRILMIDHTESALREIAVPYGLCRPVFKDPLGIIFKAEQAFREDRDPPAVSFYYVFRCSLGMSFCDQFWSHIRISFQLVLPRSS